MTTNFSGGVLRDVTLRDGLQLTGGMLSTGRKVAIVRELISIGVPSIEIGSMARGDLVPSLANTLEVIAALTPDELSVCWVWVATPRHVARATEAGARNFQYCLSASEAHNQANLGRSVDTSLDGMPEATALTKEVGGRIQLCIATSFTCPFEGPVDPDRVIAIANDPRAEGADDIVICDTLGQAAPTDVASLIRRVSAETPERDIVFHGHDTWGLGVANALAALGAGASTVDGAIGGLGGCPFAPGASGNTASEDLLFAMRPAWLVPEKFARLVELSETLLAELDEPNRSKARQGALSNAPQFPWAISASLSDR